MFAIEHVLQVCSYTLTWSHLHVIVLLSIVFYCYLQNTSEIAEREDAEREEGEGKESFQKGK